MSVHTSETVFEDRTWLHRSRGEQSFVESDAHIPVTVSNGLQRSTKVHMSRDAVSMN